MRILAITRLIRRRKRYGVGGKLYRLNLEKGQLVTLLADRAGGVRDPQVHYDGRTILFLLSPRSGEEPLPPYEIDSDGTGLRQLTDGPYERHRTDVHAGRYHCVRLQPLPALG